MYKEYIVTKDFGRAKKGDKRQMTAEAGKALSKKGLVKLAKGETPAEKEEAPEVPAEKETVVEEKKKNKT